MSCLEASCLALVSPTHVSNPPIHLSWSQPCFFLFVACFFFILPGRACVCTGTLPFTPKGSKHTVAAGVFRELWSACGVSRAMDLV
ncbi:hypothetical protein J3F84DRAFT_379875 [Trichoderma pleuroticola]